jgi:hypothetical protein
MSIRMETPTLNDYIITLEPGDSTEIAVDSINPAYPAILEANTTISEKLKWKQAGSYPIASFRNLVAKGIWIAQYDKYIGYRMRRKDGYHYAWLKLTVSPEANFITLHVEAYELTPGKPIRAGQTVGMQELFAELFSIGVRDDNLQITSRQGEALEFSLLDMSGKQVLVSGTAGTTASADVSSLTTGIYTVQVRSGEGMHVSKIFLQ